MPPAAARACPETALAEHGRPESLLHNIAPLEHQGIPEMAREPARCSDQDCSTTGSAAKARKRRQVFLPSGRVNIQIYTNIRILCRLVIRTAAFPELESLNAASFEFGKASNSIHQALAPCRIIDWCGQREDRLHIVLPPPHSAETTPTCAPLPPPHSSRDAFR
jgi:hypothetical protein